MFEMECLTDTINENIQETAPCDPCCFPYGGCNPDD